MDLQESVPLRQIADFIEGYIVGDENIKISSINEIHKVKKGSLTFTDNDKYLSIALYSLASVVIVHKEVACPPNKAIIICKSPFDAYNKLAIHYKPYLFVNSSISETAVIGEGTHLEPNVVVGNHAKIGRNCLIKANVTISDYSEIGDNVVIHPSSVIGGDAFYYKKQPDGTYTKWHTIGRVIIQDNVEIGSCCTIDRGVSGDTIIGKGTKIDNQVHIAHGVVIGTNCLIAAQVGIAGKTVIQDNVILYGQVGVSKSLVIGEGAVILAQSGVSKSLQGERTYFGSPAAETRQRFKELASLRRLPEFFHEYDQSNGKKIDEPDPTEMLGPDFEEEK